MRGLQGAQAISVGGDQIERVRRQTSETQRAAAIEKQIAADRARAAREQSRADGEMLRARQSAERQLLTALSTLGGENRALSQRIVFEQRLTAAVNQGIISQQRANELRVQANSVFSTASVHARDLRVNMASLAGQMTALAVNSSASLAPLSNMLRVLQSIRLATSTMAGGVVGGGSAGRLGGGVASGAVGAATLAIGATAAAGVGAVAGMGAALREAAQAQAEFAKIEAVIRSTGSAAGRTAQQVDDLGNSISLATGTANEDVNAAAAQLLTFRSVAGDTFERTLKLAADLSTVFGSMGSATLQLGKALEDPVSGMTALRRVGISFTEAQREQIKALVESGDQLEAQNRILAIVEGQVGGVSEAVGQTLTGAYHRLVEAGKLWLENAGTQTGVIGVLTGMMNRLAEAAQRATESQSGPTAQEQFDSASANLAAEQARQDRFGKLGVKGLASSLAGDRVAAAEQERFAALNRLREEQQAAFDAGSSAKEAENRRKIESTTAAYEEQRDSLDKVGKAQREYRASIKVIEAQEQNLGGVTAETTKLRGLAKTALDAATGATHEATKASGGYTKALSTETDERARSLESLDEYIDGLRNQVAFASLDERSRTSATAAFEAYNRAVKAGAQNASEYAQQASDAALATYDIGKAQAAQKQAAAEAAREAERSADDARKIAQEPYLEAARNIETAFADTFKGIFHNGIKSFKDLGSKILDIMIDLAAQVASLLIFKPVVNGLLGEGGLGGVGGGGGGGGLLGNLGGLLQNALSFFGGGGSSTLASSFTGSLGEISGAANSAADALGDVAAGGSKASGFLAGLGGAGPVGLLAGIGTYAVSQLASMKFETKQDKIASGITMGSLVGGPFTLWLMPFAGSIAKLFGGEVKKAVVQAQTGGTNFEGGFTAQGPFGTVGLSNAGTKNTPSAIDKALVEQLAEMDRSFANTLTKTQIGVVADYLQSHPSTPTHAVSNPLTAGVLASIDRMQQYVNALFQGNSAITSIPGQINNRIAMSGGNANQVQQEIANWLNDFIHKRNQTDTSLQSLRDELNNVPDAQMAITNLNASFDALTVSMQGLYYTSAELAEVESLRARSLEKLKTDFVASMTTSALEITDPTAAKRQEILATGKASFADAQAFGVGAAEVLNLVFTQMQELKNKAIESRKVPDATIQSIRDDLSNVSHAQVEIRNLNAEFDDLIATMKSLAYTSSELTEVESLRSQSLEKLKTDFVASMTTSALAITDPVAARRADILATGKENFASAQTLGVGAAEALNLIFAQMAELNKEAKKSAQQDASTRLAFENDTASRILELRGHHLQALLLAEQQAGQSRLDAAETAGANLSAVAARNEMELSAVVEKFFASSLSSINGLQTSLTASTASPLPPEIAQQNAFGEFVKATFTAQSGDPSQLAAAASAYLETSQAVFHSGEKFQQAFDIVTDTLARFDTTDELARRAGVDPASLVTAGDNKVAGEVATMSATMSSQLTSTNNLLAAANAEIARLTDQLKTANAATSDGL